MQPIDLTASPGASPPRRVLRSRQGHAGVIVDLGEGGTLSTIIQGRKLDACYNVSCCKSKRCMTCKNLILEKKVKSNVTHRKYEAVSYVNEVLNCHTQNLIYLLTCLCCGIQYVGETAIPLHKRINIHRTSKEGCEHEIRHRDSVCDGFHFSIQIIEKLPGSGYLSDGSLDPEMTKIRQAKEDEWIKKLRTIYPYGLNEKASEKVTDSNTVEPAIGKLFPPLPRDGVRGTRCRENRNSKISAYSTKDFFEKLENLLLSDLVNSFNEIRKILNNTKKKVLKEIAFYILERTKFIFHEKRFQWYHYILDIIDTKFLKPIVEKKKSIPKNVITIHFVNKGLDDIHISRILRSTEVINLLPDPLKSEDDIPTCTFKLDPPIRSKILNYRETVSSLNVEIDEDVSFVRDLPTCECENSQFCDPHHNHVITGDLRFVTNVKLRQLLSKGPNYREARTINFKKCKDEIQSSISSCVENLAAKYELTKEQLKPWENKIMELVVKRISLLKSKITISATKPFLQDQDVTSALAELHNKFVIVPIDKASNNIAIVCKRFYIQKLLNEVGVPGDASSTYKLSERNPDDIINDNSMLCEQFSLKLEERLKSLPFMYWLPKMHYSPPRFRFIVASSSCSTKPLSSLASTVYKHIFNQVRNFHDKSTFYKNYNRFWVIENSKPIIEKIEKINSRTGAKDISTYDFSTLYTKLPHDDIIKNLSEIVDFAFSGGNVKKDGNRRFLTVRGKSAYWTRKSHGKNSLSKAKVKQLTSHLIKETYFMIGDKLFHQCIGIPMGIDPAPFWANLHLYSYECEFITSLMRSDKGRAMKFRSASRFIDDECNLNDGGEFGRSFREIYPPELELKCEHEGSHATFLDLDINIVNGKYVYKLFDKRNNFPFFIVRMPDYNGNIPAHVFYGSVMSEFLRIARSTKLYEDFLPVASKLFNRMKNQGGSTNQILNQIKKGMVRHPSSFNFSKTTAEMIKDIQNTRDA